MTVEVQTVLWYGNQGIQESGTVITFTMTTFNRLALFKKTMASFMATCEDLDLIDRWIISDDGSPAEELAEMQRLYPFLEIRSNPGQGQASNLNFLFSHVDTKWFFHCEDDWLFLEKDHYIRKMIDVAEHDPRNKNVTLRFWLSDGRLTGNGLPYNVHRHKPCDPETAKTTNGNWLGYSLNPGLQHKATVDMLGAYDEKHDISDRCWDRLQARLYLEKGLQAANLCDKKYIEHIGWDLSAYWLRGGSNPRYGGPR